MPQVGSERSNRARLFDGHRIKNLIKKVQQISDNIMQAEDEEEA